MSLQFPSSTLPSTLAPDATGPSGQRLDPRQRPPVGREEADTRQWHSAYQRLLDEDEAVAAHAAVEASALPLLPPTPVLPPRPELAPPLPLAGLAPLSATAQRLAAEAAAPVVPLSLVPGGMDALRVWQVELPAAGPGWQLQVQQAQPLAPLMLDLRVPAAAQPQARQQLADLDRRLREAGHDTLRARCSDRAGPGVRRGPLDEHLEEPA